MKIAIGSDLHLEFGELALTNAENAKVLLLPGDICVARDFEFMDNYSSGSTSQSKRAIKYYSFFQQASKLFEHVIYVPGNHEHYHGDYKYTKTILERRLSDFLNIYVLDKDSKTIDDVTFVGATLWTNMNNGDPLTMQHIKSMMNDFQCVKNSEKMLSRKVPLYEDKTLSTQHDGPRKIVGYKFKEEPSTFSPQDAFEDHVRAFRYIQHVVEQNNEQKIVVVTHHSPSMQSCSDWYKHDTIMNGGFHSELGNYIAYHPQIKVWTHGHTHDRFDYTIGETRVICNPRGYIGHEQGANTFDLVYVDV